MAHANQQEFGKLRSLLFPIHTYELKKLIPMLIMAFCISYNYTILRDTKDGIIVTNAGAEAIAFLKIAGTVPAALLFAITYSKLSNVLSRERLFYTTLVSFLTFFGFFAVVLYPCRSYLHLSDATAEAIRAALPAGWAGLAGCIQHWTYSLFYIASELWGSAILSLLFWGFANQITKVAESKRFYTMFGIGFNLALIASGPAIILVSNVRHKLEGTGIDPWGYSLYWLMGMVVLNGLIIMGTYWWMNRNVLTDPRFYDPTQVKKKKDKPKLGIMDSIKFLLNSKYLLCLCIIVMGYGIAINLVEVTWKSQLKLQYPTENEYTTFMGRFSFCTGIVTNLMVLFVGGNFIRLMGWRFSALFTPIMLVTTGIGFFGFILYSDALTAVAMVLNVTPLFLAVILGAAQNVLSKSSKYSLFDPTKEMTYIPLDEESKVKGKAAIDVVGARLGKSGGALIQIFLFSFVGPLSVVTPYIAAILVVIIGMWVVATMALSKMFEAKSTEHAKQQAAKEKEFSVSEIATAT